jgi:hypothetical protein
MWFGPFDFAGTAPREKLRGARIFLFGRLISFAARFVGFLSQLAKQFQETI